MSTEKKTILILANSTGGLCDFRGELVEALCARYRVVVSVPDDLKKAQLEAMGCTLLHTPIDRRGTDPLTDLRLQRTYEAMLEDVRPAAVLCYTIKPNVYGGYACRKKKIPYLVTITGLGTAFEKKGLLRWVAETLYRRGLKGAGCVFFQNAENQRLFEERGLVSGRHRLVNGSGVNLQKHVPLPYPEEDDVVRFLQVGRAMKQKGTDEYLAAAQALHSDKVHFYMIGYSDEGYEEQLKELGEKGVIYHLGFHTDVDPFYGAASAVVVASRHEGLSNVLLEGAACARPLLASRIPGCVEAFEEGKTGLGFAPQNVPSLVDALRRFLALSPAERREMGLRGRAKMEKEFDRRQVTEAYLSELRALLEEETA